MPRVTLQKIAETAGLSKATVGYILRGQGERFTQESRDAVLRIASDLGYRSHGAARAMSLGRFGAIGLVNSTEFVRSHFSAALLQGIYLSLQEQGQQLTVASLSDESLTDPEQLPRILSELSVDGLILNCSYAAPAGLPELLTRLQIPVVWLNTKLPTNAIFVDDHAAGLTATEHLLDLGHRRIAYLDPEIGRDDEPHHWHYSMRDREAGYRETMHAAGREPLVWRPPFRRPPSETVDLCRKWLDQQPLPTAILTYAPRGAHALLVACAERKINVPADMSLMTFSNHPPDDLQLTLDYMAIPEEAVGQAAVVMLNQLIDEGRADLPSVTIPLHFTAGNSVIRRSP